MSSGDTPPRPPVLAIKNGEVGPAPRGEIGDRSASPTSLSDPPFESHDHNKTLAQIQAAYEQLVSRRESMFSDTSYGAPAEINDMNGTQTHVEDSKRRKQYYDEQFRSKDSISGTVRERVQRDSPVVAELRTNVIIKDEFSLVTDLSYNLSQRYARPESSIMVLVDHSACLLLSGSFDPAYILTITALSSQLQPTTNKRNAALIQSFMADIISVPPERGIVRFAAIPEENYAINGTTLFGTIERMEKQTAEENSTWRKRASNRKSMTMRSKSANKLATGDVEALPQLPRNGGMAPVLPSGTDAVFELPGIAPERPTQPPKKETNGVANETQMDERPRPLSSNPTNRANVVKVPENRSRTPASTTQAQPQVQRSKSIGATEKPKKPPPVPEEKELKTSKVQKRKSLLSVFKR